MTATVTQDVRSRFPTAPTAIQALPLDRRGFPVPWFIQWIDGEPDFRVADSRKLPQAVRHRRCWICGGKLGRMLSFVIGPMCAVNRISSEPPSHPTCAVFAAEACPFLTRPLAKRPDTADLTERFPNVAMPGLPILHNPGVTLVWGTLKYRVVRDHANGVLFEIGKPERTQWFREGRAATRTEILEAISLGLPVLNKAAEDDGPAAAEEITARLRTLMKLLPE